jgi:6-phosphogluconolactonase
MKPFFSLLLLPLLLACTEPSPSESQQAPPPPAAPLSLYLGSGASDTQMALRRFELDPQSGALSLKQTYAGLSELSYATLSPDQAYLYAVSKAGGSGSVVAFRREENGGLTLLNAQDSEGEGPCFVSIDHTGKWVLVANYAGGTVSVFPVAMDGSLRAVAQVIAHQGASVNQQRQEGPHPHMIAPSPNNQYVLVTDLGTDQVMIYAFDAATGRLSPATPPAIAVTPGFGPRHFAYHPSKPILYVLNELGAQVSVITTDAQGAPQTAIQTAPLLPEGFTDPNKAADIHLTPNGEFLYATNRGHNSLAMFRVETSGQLTALGHEPVRGQTPRNFAIDPTGNVLLVANRGSNQVVVFRIDRQTGRLVFLAEYDVPNVMCIKFIE